VGPGLKFLLQNLKARIFRVAMKPSLKSTTYSQLEHSKNILQSKYEEIEKDLWKTMNKNSELKDMVRKLKYEVNYVQEEKYSNAKEIDILKHKVLAIETELRREKERTKANQAEQKKLMGKYHDSQKNIKKVEKNFETFGEYLLQLGN
jgi:chromosome segregation ATPase